ncbi:protein-disulfide reductase DsbD family protein [Marinimicrobium alkaliphilum]|uniref:protein-disulfide reductase DsbD family protein n=1 Tax=Marinimicrobium alkaliphilum TaxID=2202654 RepID=UPI000DBA1F72|nr:protein-disulfide reductase DsbD domain-containing protein [Marinimicrobium alkaliphilum]
MWFSHLITCGRRHLLPAFVVLASALGLTPTVLANERLSADHVEVRWLAPETFAEGETVTLGVYFEIDPGWHLYWRNPGDSGAEPRFQFSGNADVGDILWPIPKRMAIAHLTNIGYEDHIAYLFEVTPEAGAEQLLLEVDLEWLVCEVECIPGFGVLRLERAVSAETRWPDSERAIKTHFSARLPQPASVSPWQITGAWQQLRQLFIDVAGEGDEPPQLFPGDGGFVASGEPDWEPTERGFRAQIGTSAMAAPETLDLVLVEGERGWAFPSVLLGDAPATRVSEPLASATFWVLLLSALIGGVILNLMPCVFPVLSIKLFSLINAQGEGGAALAHRTREGLLYTAGVLTTFAALGALFLVLRASGAAVGWGFQLQSPGVVLGLALLFWVMALSFLGVFEFGHGLMRLAGKSQGSSSFMTGVLAVFVAAPCTGPFMGAALGASATLPPIQAMAIFIGLGLGLALPFLILALSPRLSARLPRPGAWMDTLRQFLAFPLFATVIWLLWVLGRLLGDSGWLLGSSLLLLVAFAIWLAKAQRALWRTIALLLAIGATLVGLYRVETQAPPTPGDVEGEWSAYNPARISEARATGQAVFIDYTAAWCITCQVNKTLVLDTREANELFARHDVLRIRADWTRYDQVITDSLAQLGRSSIPVYAFYPADGGEVQLLPQVLTLSILREIFD